jgi:ISXO2-like transposase domain
MIKKWDGLPTTRYLRHRNVEIEKPTRERYKARLAKLTGLSFPSAEDEACDPLAADAIYASAIAALRERRRGKTYRLVFNENYNYGMTRNLLGLRRRESHGKVLIKRLRRADRSSPVSPRSRFSIWEKAHYPMRGAFDAVSASDGLVWHRILGISGSPSSDTRKSHLMTDELTSYEKIGKEFDNHSTVNHSAEEYVRFGGFVYVNTAECRFSLMKRAVFGTHHSISQAHLPRYLREWDFKWNTRHAKDGERAAKALKGIESKRLTYRISHQTANTQTAS